MNIPNSARRKTKFLSFSSSQGQVNNTLDTIRTNTTRHRNEHIFFDPMYPANTSAQRHDLTSILKNNQDKDDSCVSSESCVSSDEETIVPDMKTIKIVDNNDVMDDLCAQVQMSHSTLFMSH